MTHSALSALAVLAVLFVPAAAHADVDLFAVTGHGLDLTFTLPSSPAPLGFNNGIDFFLGNVSFTEGGTIRSATTVHFYTQDAGGGFELENGFGNPIDNLNFFGTILFTGSAKMPTFRQGDFQLTGGPACSIENESSKADLAPDAACGYNVRIEPTALAPEPCSFAFLATGALGLFGVARRRVLV